MVEYGPAAKEKAKGLLRHIRVAQGVQAGMSGMSVSSRHFGTPVPLDPQRMLGEAGGLEEFNAADLRGYGFMETQPDPPLR